MKHVVPSRVALHGLVVPERDQQIGKRLDRNIERGNRFVQRDENGVRGYSRVAIAQLQVPVIEQREGFSGIGNFVTQIVRPAAVGIQIVEMLVQPAWEQPGNDVEIFIVMRGEPARVALGLHERAPGWREFSSYFKLSRYLHDAGRNPESQWNRLQPVGFDLARTKIHRLKPALLTGLRRLSFS